MILTIDKRDIELFEKVCALKSFDITRYTKERNANMIALEVTHHGEELSLHGAFYLGRDVQQEIDERLMKRVTE